MGLDAGQLAALEAADETSVAQYRDLLALRRRHLTGAIAAAEPAAGAELATAMATLDDLRRRVETTDLILTGRYANSEAWALTGARSCGAWLAVNTETSRANAARRSRTGCRLLTLPATLNACLTGTIGAPKARLLTRMADDDRLRDLYLTHETEIIADIGPLTVDGTRHYLNAWQIRAKATLGIEDPEPGHDPIDHLHLSHIGDWRSPGLTDI